MAELVLSRVGEAIGGRIGGTLFAALGRAAGAYLGGRIDQAVFGGTQRVEGPRLTDFHIQGSTEGASIPAVYGRVRLAGQVIWAARFKEHVDTRKVSGGKGGPSAKVTTYRYSLSFAVGLCEGTIGSVTRAWANGEPFDLSNVACRIYQGSEDQAPDPLIEAIEGADHAPAYRGLAYILFEDLPLDAFGNVIPQFSFEIARTPARTAPGLEDMVKGVCLIPGTGEFAYATDVVRHTIAAGQEAPENSHASQERANLLVALDQLEADLPHCRSVMLVVSWFGTDLRCGECEIRPGVEIAEKNTRPVSWRAGGVTREDAHLISQIDGAAAYGGSPSDASVVQAIAELKARGFQVWLYPFVLMDVPAGNSLPDPYGASAQAAYPWRGRITCHPAAGEAGTPDKSGAAGAQVAAFFGAADAGDFMAAGDTVNYAGPDEWSFRRFILHYAKLAQAAGGVDAFVLGSELRGLTTIRSGASTYPAVAALKALAADVDAVLNPDPLHRSTKITYAADWSEYHGHQPTDGSRDVFYHLDPLWADDAIDAIGVDWYLPLTDWREGSSHADAEIARSIYDPDYLQSRIEGGEHYDWFYASDADRAAQTRTPITDGAYGKPWVFRAKDIRSWWANAHHDRPGGVESATPTAWTARSKPVWFVEFGCPAIDKGANAPNLFVDPKSAESAAPPFSTRAPDDLIQRRLIEAYVEYWDEDGANNPISPIYHSPMIAMDFAHVWAWDARPFPYFPARTDLWSDGPAWRLGHWLNGRAGAALLPDVVRDLAMRAGDDDADVSGLSGVVAGYVADAPSSPRALIEPLMDAFGFDAREHEGRMQFYHRGADIAASFTLENVVQTEQGRIEIIRADGADAPAEARVRFIDPARDYRVAMVSARQRDAAGKAAATLDAPMCLDTSIAEGIAQRLLIDASAGIEMAGVGLPPSLMALEPGDRVMLDAEGAPTAFRIESIEDGRARLIPEPTPRAAVNFTPTPAPPTSPRTLSPPDFLFLDLPPLPNAEDDDRPLAAAYAAPWPGSVDMLAGPSTPLASLRAIAERPAIVGRLTADLAAGPIGRWDEANIIHAALSADDIASVSAAALLEGANLFAIQNAGGAWEIVQARTVTLAAPGQYELSGLLRGQQGTDAAMGAASGARIVALDQRLVRLDMRPHEEGAALTFVAVATGRAVSDPAASISTAPWARVYGRPFSPCHIRGKRDGSGDIILTWVRRARLGGDAWAGADPPPGEESENYQVEIVSGGAVIRTLSASAPTATYAAADQIADFGTPPASLTVRIAQISARFGAGSRRESTIWV